MKRRIVALAFIFVVSQIILPFSVYAQKGDNGYEGGISIGIREGKTPLEYEEVCFITGEPMVLEGTVTINKSKKQDTINATYTYNLRNTEKGATLTRTLVYSIKLSKSGDGQETEKISFARTPTEVLRVNNDNYILRSYEFDFSSLTDPQPAINYYAGSLRSKKVYQIGNANDGRTVTQEITGKTYGYDQHWGNIETKTLNYEITWEKPEIMWGGYAQVNLSASVTNELMYMQNIPEQISFEGGYIQLKNNSSILTYSCRLPELDSKGEPTYRMIETGDSLKLEMPPEQTSLPVPELSYLRGHWVEEEIKKLLSLQVFKSNKNKLDPEKCITRAEFISTVMEVIKEVPQDPDLIEKTTEKRSTASSRRRGTAIEEEKPLFIDVPKDHPYYRQIDDAYKKSLISGRGKDKFAPEDNISISEVSVLFIRALGLESLAPNPYAITPFSDDSEIPEYARNAVYVANMIGLINGDERGYLNPNSSITIGHAAILLNKFINYMCDGIKNHWEKNIKNTYSF